MYKKHYVLLTKDKESSNMKLIYKHRKCTIEKVR